jgi:hypothetical protein
VSIIIAGFGVVGLLFVALAWDSGYNDGYRRGHHDGLKDNFNDRRKAVVAEPEGRGER